MPINLYVADKKSRFQVTSVPNIGLLESMGLRSGTHVTIQNRYALGGPVILRVEDAYDLALGKDIALQIGVEQVAAS
ncbi:MAG: ferrous iron transport protein A [Defluviitaleaceae bacterium]|nr:ferrous iron transport protein A [Defluviitaleaceae bacterium]